MDDYQAALGKALKKLSQGDRLEAELRQDLQSFEAQTVDHVVEFLKERRLVDDKRTIENFIERKTGRRAMGTEKLKAELMRRGAPEEMIDVELARNPVSEEDYMAQVLAARFKTTDSRARAGRFLLSRGFSEESIGGALDRFFGPLPD